MAYILFQSTKTAVRWAFYLAFIGELSQCTLDLQEKSGKALQHGLINIKSLNDELNRR